MPPRGRSGRRHRRARASRRAPVMMSGGKVLSKDFPAITHFDGSARVQTLSKKDNLTFYKIIQSFQNLSGHPVILNTSFNLHGFPIVSNPIDALKVLDRSGLRYLALGNHWIEKK